MLWPRVHDEATGRGRARGGSAHRAFCSPQLITLDTVSFNMLSLAPVSEYDLYIKKYGKSDARQVATQCQEDRWVLSVV